MKWKELLLNLGTPVVETMMAEEIGEVVIFQKDDHSNFVVVESIGMMPARAVYGSEKEIKAEFPKLKLIQLTPSVYYLLKEIPENIDEIRKIEEISEKLRSIEKLESRITRHIYQLEGLDTVVSSLLEPIQMEIILSMAADALSELFVTSIALYRFSDGMYRLLVNLGREGFPEEFEGKDLTDPTKYNGVLNAKNHLGEDGILIPVKERGQNKYILYLKRDVIFTPEEKSLLNALIRILTRTREYLERTEEVTKLNTLLSQARFIIESLGEFSKNILSIHNREIFMSFVVDMIREMLQLEWAALYEKKDGGQLLRSAQVKSVDIPGVLPEEGEEWKRYEINLDDEKYVLLLGEPITEGFLEEFKDMYITIVIQVLEEAFKNMAYQTELIERERRIRTLVHLIRSIEDFVKGLQYKKTPGEVYKHIFEYVKENYGVEGMRVRLGGMEVAYGELKGELVKAEVGEEKGTVEYYRSEGFSEEEASVLRTLSKGSMTLLSKMYLLQPSYTIVDAEDAMLRFLREKAALEGMNVDRLKFYLVEEKYGDEIESLGVGLKTEKGIILAVDDESKLKGVGIEYKEL